MKSFSFFQSWELRLHLLVLCIFVTLLYYPIVLLPVSIHHQVTTLFLIVTGLVFIFCIAFTELNLEIPFWYIYLEAISF